METQTNDKPDVECKCPICQEPTATPKTTSCRHTFCQSCLDKWLETKHTCPMCRTKIRDTNNFTQTHNPTEVGALVRGLTFNHPIEELYPFPGFVRHYNMHLTMSGIGGLAYSN